MPEVEYVHWSMTGRYSKSKSLNFINVSSQFSTYIHYQYKRNFFNWTGNKINIFFLLCTKNQQLLLNGRSEMNSNAWFTFQRELKLTWTLHCLWYHSRVGDNRYDMTLSMFTKKTMRVGIGNASAGYYGNRKKHSTRC